MKIQLIERGGKYFLKKYFLGFFPLYWDEEYDGGWQWFQFDIDESRAEELMASWVKGHVQKSRFKTSQWKTVNTIHV
jgi:hypothetical protein